MKPFVSILIPCFNAERWIQQAIESALAQTWADKEVIVVDDGSTDASADIIGRFGDKIRFERGPNRGGNVARNRLLQLAKGDWLQYLDADDYLKPGKLASQMSVLAKQRDIDVLFGPSTIEWHYGDKVSVTRHEIAGPYDSWRLLALWQLPQTGAPLWRRSAIDEVGGWAVGQLCCQEHELYLRMLMAGKRFAYHPMSGSVYRRFADGSVSTRDPALVRRERLKIERRIEHHLLAVGELTPDRQWAIDQARFEMARSAWSQDRYEARAIVAEISDRAAFSPRGDAAPALYRLVFRMLGFEMAEHVARIKRLAWRRSYQTSDTGARDAVR